jgi:hypothetical protein
LIVMAGNEIPGIGVWRVGSLDCRVWMVSWCSRHWEGYHVENGPGAKRGSVNLGPQTCPGRLPSAYFTVFLTYGSSKKALTASGIGFCFGSCKAGRQQTSGGQRHRTNRLPIAIREAHSDRPEVPPSTGAVRAGRQGVGQPLKRFVGPIPPLLPPGGAAYNDGMAVSRVVGEDAVPAKTECR